MPSTIRGSDNIDSALLPLQVAVATDTGGSTSSTSLVNVNNANVSITPRRSDSRFVVEVMLQGEQPALSGQNPQAAYRLYDVTNAAYIGVEYALFSATSAGGVGVRAPITLRAVVASTGLTVRSFVLHAKTSNASSPALATNHVWTITEVL